MAAAPDTAFCSCLNAEQLCEGIVAAMEADRIAMLQIKRVYEPAANDDGERFLVDRLWPRGVQKASLAIRAWLKEAAPSNDLRNWYHHDVARWDEFRRRYFSELEANPESWQPLVESARRGNVTLLYSSKEPEHNNAVALKEFVLEKLQVSGRGTGRPARRKRLST